MTNANPTFDEWLQQGYEKGFCSPPICPQHDGIPMTFAEEQIEETDGEVCVHIVRLYQDDSERQAVERNHPPTIWRAKNLGW